MSEQKHIVKRQIIELKLNNSDQAHAIQAEVSRIYRERIIPLIDYYCTQISTPNRIHRIDTLVIDIGTLDLEHLEANLVSKVTTEFHRSLAEHITELDLGAERQNTQSDLELFAYFVRTGSLPWWVDSSTSSILDTSLREAIINTPDALRKLLFELIQESHFRQRIVNQYTDELLTSLAALLVPAIADYKQRLLEGSLTVSIAGHSAGTVRQIIWNSILLVGGTDGRTFRKPDSFFTAALSRAASELGITRSMLAIQFPVLLPTITVNQVSDLLADLRAVTVRLPEAVRAQWSIAVSNFESSFGDTSTLPSDAMRALLVQLQTIFLDHGFSSDVTHNGLEEVEQVIRVRLPPDDSEPVYPKESRSLESALDLSFSEADELFIANAGLVILWPFLSQFFARLGLLEDRQFKDRGAQHRAAGLLQFLATGDNAFPEYFLPLNKLLCGIEFAEVFDFGEPLRDTEAEESTNLLGAIIQQVPILHDMSVAGFRGTFLLREGMLSLRDDAWLLRVERQTYDIVLERLPWGWDWVKFPWTDAALRVEWL